MHSALFIATQPEDKRAWDHYLGFVLSKVKSPDRGVLRLSENVWLLNLQQKEGVAGLGHLVVFADQREIAYGILALQNAPEWLPADFDPKPI